MKPTLPRPMLMLVTEPHPNLAEIVAATVRGGVNVVQWRDRNTSQEVLHKIVPAMIGATTSALLLANGPPINSRGMHLPSHVKFGNIHRTITQNMLVGQSAHSVEQAIISAQSGADYLIAGTIFASQSHPNVAPHGLGFLHDVCALVTIPVIAIGGITPARVPECLAAGAAGVAVLSPIMRAADPGAVARSYRQALETAWKAKQCA